MRRGDVEAELLHQPGESRRLALGQIEDEPGQGRGVDDGMLERAFQSTTHQPGVERVVAVLHEHRSLREAEECPSRISELRSSDQHRAIDVVPPTRVGVDRRAAVDEGVEEGKWAVEPEAFGADLEHQEWGITRRLHVEGDELGVFEPGLGTKLGCVDRDLLPRHGLGGAARLQVEGLGDHLARARARRAKAISSEVTARRTTEAAE